MPVQIKICGLTNVAQAYAVAEAGADAIGLVFFPLSPRNVTLDQAKEIRDALPAHVTPVGVFVDMPLEEMIITARHVGLNVLQLHGNETGFTIQVLKSAGFRVIKSLRSSGRQLLLDAMEFELADSLLTEASQGILPGGNGEPWNWSEARKLADIRPYILAGGLNASNIVDALEQSGASAVDLSSAAESSPGQKDLEKVKAIIAAVRSYVPTTPIGVVFP